MTAKITVGCFASAVEVTPGAPPIRPWAIVIESDTATANLIMNDAAVKTETGDGGTYKKVEMNMGDLVLLRNMLNAMPWP